MIRIQQNEVSFRFSRSSGPGGQNVNKLNTRVTLLFDVAGCKRLTGDQKERVERRLSHRITQDGMLRVVCQKYRTQGANKAAAIARLDNLVRGALQMDVPRKKVTVPHWAKQRRLEEKRRRGRIKQQRHEGRSVSI